MASATTAPLKIDRPRPKCSYPQCKETVVEEYHGKPFCRTHLEMGKFIDWWIDYMLPTGPVENPHGGHYEEGGG